MKIDIWSDIRCPFCYIGKRKFEAALNQFEHKDEVVINWHSFELDPFLKTKSNEDIFDYFAERKNTTREKSILIHNQLAEKASFNGLQFNFEKAVVAGSFDAHRLIQLANMHGRGGEAEEKLFKAYFTDGKDISDHQTLINIGVEIGLDENETREVIEGDAFTYHVRSDESQARSIGVTGVPYFVINDRYAISGAQPANIFFDTLRKAWSEFELEKPVDVHN